MYSTRDGWGASRTTLSRASASISSHSGDSSGYAAQASKKSCQTSTPRSSHAAIEIVALKDPAAPDAYQIHVGGDGLVQPAPESLGRDPGQEVIIGDPVDAFDEHRLAIDRNGECGADVVAEVSQFDRSKPTLSLPPIEFLIVGGQRDE